MSFVQLPGEILKDILRCLDSEDGHAPFIHTRAKPSICALSLSNQVISNIARTVLFEEVRLPTELMRDDASNPDAHGPKSVQAFINACKEDPGILKWVKKVSYRWRSVHEKDILVNLLNALASAS